MPAFLHLLCLLVQRSLLSLCWSPQPNRQLVMLWPICPPLPPPHPLLHQQLRKVCHQSMQLRLCWLSAALLLGTAALVRTPASCTLSVGALQQCGGRGGVCANQGANSSQCRDAQWDNACCTSGYYCQRKQQWAWTCERSEVDTNLTLAGQVSDYMQCGGLGNCAQSLCADAVWTNYSCYTGFACLRWDAFYWQCRDIPFAQVAISA